MKLLLCFIVSLLISLIIHEMGHAFFSVITRTRITGVNVGVGPRIWSNNLLCVKLFPISGNVECELDISNKKGIIKMAFIAMGGCVFNAVLLIISVNFINGSYSLILAFINLIMCISSMVPAKGSDMYTVLVGCGLINGECD